MVTTQTQSKVSDPSRRVIKSSLTVRRFGNKRRDKRETEKVNAVKGAKVQIGTVDRHILLPQAMHGIEKAERQVRAAHKRYSMPYSDGGRLILLSRFGVWNDGMIGAKRNFDNAVDELLAKLDYWIAETEEKSEDWWDSSLIPVAGDLRATFGVSHTWSQLGFQDFDALGLLDDESQARLTEEIREQEKGTLTAAVNDVYGDMLKKIGEMAKRVSPETKRVKEVGYEDFQILMDLVPEFNLTDDPQLTRLHEEVSALMTETRLSADVVRTATDDKRTEISSQFQTILDKFS